MQEDTGSESHFRACGLPLFCLPLNDLSGLPCGHNNGPGSTVPTRRNDRNPAWRASRHASSKDGRLRRSGLSGQGAISRLSRQPSADERGTQNKQRRQERKRGGIVMETTLPKD